MEKRFTRFLVAAALAVVAQVASAQGDSWYFAGNVGASFPNDVDSSGPGLSVTTELDTGFLVSGALGRSFGNLRADGEVFYNINDVSTLSALGLSIGASGDVSTLGLMVNGYYDFATGTKWKPYLGAGIGAANVSINDLSAAGVPVADDDDTVFAYQFKAGVGYEFSPQVDGMLGYRFFGTDDGDFVDVDGDAFSTDGADAHIVEVGVRVRF